LSDPLAHLRDLTPARLQFERAGVAQTTDDLLRFQADHAHARDAVRRPFAIEKLAAAIREDGLEVTTVRSRARDLGQHLRRPDLGRQVYPEDRARLQGAASVVVIVSDGLSSGAAERYARRLLGGLKPPPKVVLVPFGRVAIGDEVGEALHAEFALVLVGERPGLSAPESLGAYLTYRPRKGRTDAERVCLSNIRDDGTPPETAALRLNAWIGSARQVGGTGVGFTLTDGDGAKPVLE